MNIFQEISDIKSIVKNSVEKIYDLFNHQEMKTNSKIISRKSNDINFNEPNDTKKSLKNNEVSNNSIKEDKKYMKTNITFKINNYLSVLNKNKASTNEGNNATINTIEDDNSYLQKKFKKNKEYENNINNVYNLKKNKKELIKNSSNSNYIKNKTDIKLLSSKSYKEENIINNFNKDNDYLFFSHKKMPVKFQVNNYNNLKEDIKNKNEESNLNITDKSIIVNTKNKKNEINKENYIIRPTRISHINKECELTLTNEGINNQSKEIKNIYNSKNSSEKKKKYIFLKRAKTKNNGDIDVEKNKKKLIFSQNKSRTKYQLTNSRIKNFNLYSTRNEFYSNKKNNNIKEFNLKGNNIYINSLNKTKKNNTLSNLKKNKTKNKIIKDNKNTINSKNKNDENSNNLLNINNLLFSYMPHNYLSQKCQSENKLRFLENDFNKISRNKNRELSSSRFKKEDRIIDIEPKNIFISENKKNKEERNNQRKILKTLYDKKFPNKVYTNDIIKLFLLLNEYLINNNLLYDYNLFNNKNILNKISQNLSKYSSIDYPKEYDINIDNYINNIKIIQRNWRKYKIKKLLGKNEEIHELKKIVVNKYINKAGYKMKKIIGLFNSMIEDFKEIKNSDEINKMFYYIKHLIKRDLTSYEKNLIYKEFINNFK